MGKKDTSTLKPWQDRAAVGTFVGGVIASLLLFAVARRYDKQQALSEFRLEATQHARSIEREIAPTVETVSALAAFFESSDDVTPDDFRAFTQPALTRNESLAALEWAPRIAGSDRDAYVAEVRQTLADYDIREPGQDGVMVSAPARREYFPIRYISPPVDAVMGLDVIFEEQRQRDVERALARGELTVSSRFQLAEDPPDQHAVAMYVPVYPRSQVRDKALTHGGLVTGLAISLFRIQPLVEGAIDESVFEKTAVRLIDETAPNPDHAVLFASADGASDLATESEGLVSTRISLGDRKWRVDAYPRYPLGSSRPLWLLAAALLFSAALSTGLSMIRHLARLRAQVRHAKQLGQYQLIRKLGEGGMGEVYLAQHALLRRQTAIKLIRATSFSSQMLARFEREAHAASQLSHPNAITVFDFGRTPDGALYYAMEYIEGLDLEELVRKTGPLPERRVIHLLIQACGALGEAHNHGLVHRDVKPSNIMVSQLGGIDDFVKVLDFGLVKTDKPIDGDPRLSRDATMIGTPYFMAPEQMINPSAVDARADVWALGAVAYFLLSGKEVYRAKSTTQLVARCLTEPPPLLSTRCDRTIGKALEALVMSCLSRDLDERPADANALRRELSELDVERWRESDAASWWERVGLPLVKSQTDHGNASKDVVDIELEERAG